MGISSFATELGIVEEELVLIVFLIIANSFFIYYIRLFILKFHLMTVTFQDIFNMLKAFFAWWIDVF